MTSIRLPISFSLALGSTAVLFWFLAAVTAAAPDHRAWVRTVPAVEVRHIPDDPPIPPPIVEPPPPKPQPTTGTQVGPIVEKNHGLEIDRTGLLPGTDWIGLDTGGPNHAGPEQIVRTSGSDRGPVPSVRIEPDYPQSAKQRGIEGWVTFTFTVARDGSVKDVAIVDAQPRHVWDSATIRAVSSWKYQPATKDGKPVEQAGLMATYRFELER